MCTNSNRTIDYDPFHDKVIYEKSESNCNVRWCRNYLERLTALAIDMTILHSAFVKNKTYTIYVIAIVSYINVTY